jgi:eukaryotic translation initiation factor 2C
MDIWQARPDNLEAALTKAFQQSSQVLAQQGAIGQQLELLIIVLPDANARFFMLSTLNYFKIYIVSFIGLYFSYNSKVLFWNFLTRAGRVKRLCKIELGVITQCCMPRNVQKGDQKYHGNLSLKVNVKVR